MDKNELNICPKCLTVEKWGITTLENDFKTNLNKIQDGLYTCSLVGISLSPHISNVDRGFLPSSLFLFCLECTTILLTDREVFDMRFDGDMIPSYDCNIEELTPEIKFNISINYLRRNISNIENCICDMKVFKECTISNNNVTYQVSRSLDKYIYQDRTKPILKKNKYECNELNVDSDNNNLKIICNNCDKEVHKDEYIIRPNKNNIEISFYSYRRMWE